MTNTAPVNGQQPSVSATVKFQHLPLGARFRYVGNATVWVILERHGLGLVAKWEGNILQYAGQIICCAQDSIPAALALQVIPVD